MLVLALAIAGLVMWRSGALQGPPKTTREVWKTDVKDLSGGSFIVSDTATPAVKVTVPTVKMTDAPATPAARPRSGPLRAAT